MKLVLFVFFAATSAVAQAQESSPPSQYKAILRESFVYSTPTDNERSPPLAIRGPGPLEDEPIAMDTVTVTESIGRRDLDKAIRDRAALEDGKKFEWNRGGLIATKKIGHVDADLGLWPTLETKTLGRVGSNVIRLNVDVLHLRW